MGKDSPLRYLACEEPKIHTLLISTVMYRGSHPVLSAPGLNPSLLDECGFVAGRVVVMSFDGSAFRIVTKCIFDSSLCGRL